MLCHTVRSRLHAVSCSAELDSTLCHECSAEFFWHTISLSRPLLAFKGHASQKRKHRGAIQTKTTFYYLKKLRLRMYDPARIQIF